MNVARSSALSILLPNGKVLIAGGNNGASSALASTELYDPASNSFASAAGTATMKTGRSGATATLLPNGKVLIAGGIDAKFNALASIELYDPNTNTFAVTTAMMKTAREFAMASLLPDGKVLIAGGSDTAGNNLTSSEIYDWVANTFTAGATMNVARFSALAIALRNGKVLIAGGFAASTLATTELYMP